MKKQKVLVATDMSEFSSTAARWAHSYATQADAHVALVHIIELTVPNWLRDAYDVPNDPERSAELEEKVADWYHEHTGARPDEVILVVGAPEQALAHVATEHDADLLVVSRSGKTRFQKFFVGSTAKMLAVSAPCPVAIVHPEHDTLSKGDDIVVATDLTDTAEAAIVFAALLAKVANDPLDIVHAKRPNSSILGYDEVIDMLTEGDYDEETEKQFQQIVARHQDELADVEHNTHIIDETPVDALVQFTNVHDSAVLVLGNASEYNLLTNVFGRVSVRAMERCETTVVIVPPRFYPLEKAEDGEES